MVGFGISFPARLSWICEFFGLGVLHVGASCKFGSLVLYGELGWIQRRSLKIQRNSFSRVVVTCEMMLALPILGTMDCLDRAREV